MTARSARQRYRVLLVALVAAVAAVAMIGTGSAYSAEGPGNGLLPPPLISVGAGQVDPPPSGYLSYFFSNAGAFTYTKAEATKAATTIRLPLELFRAYINNGQTTEDAQHNQYFINAASLWALSPAGTAQQYGVFQPFTVSTLAFGSVPVTATVHLSQLLQKNGQLTPFSLLQRTLSGAVNEYFPIHVTGQVNLRLTDVMVDQVPLDVGDHCGTAQPISIKLASQSAAEYPDPISGGELTGTTDIGAFSGCVSAAGEDLSRLFTGMLSRNGNPTVLEQGTAGYWKEPNLCPTSYPDGEPACSIPTPPK